MTDDKTTPSPAAPSNTCGNCVHAERGQATDDPRIRICHRMPPTAHPVPSARGVAVMALRPQVSADDHCGEFAPEPSHLIH